MTNSDATEPWCFRKKPEEQVQERVSTLLERDALRILESVGLNSFENALNAFEEFLSNLDLFEGSTSFGKAANALDLASLAFAAVDANHDFLLSKIELEKYTATAGKRAESLGWLLAKFDALEKLSFFINGISRSEIEAARDLFHGLNFLKKNFEHIGKSHEGKEKQVLSKNEILVYLANHKGQLEEHDARGLRGLVDYLDRVEQILG